MVVGPTGDLGRGLALADGGAIDAAVIDVNLEGAMSYPIAGRLAAQGVPYMFVTGYDDWAIPETYRDVPRVGKPFPVATLLDAVEAMVVREPAS